MNGARTVQRCICIQCTVTEVMTSVTRVLIAAEINLKFKLQTIHVHSSVQYLDSISWNTIFVFANAVFGGIVQNILIDCCANNNLRYWHFM